MRLRLMALLAVLAAGCSTTPSAPPPPPPPPPLSPEAAALFTRAETPGPGAALVVNMDAMDQLGLTGKGPTMHQLGGVAITVMAQLSGSKDPKEASLFARSAVMTALLRQWASWPGVRRFALIVPSSRAVREPPALADELVGALAVDGGSPDNPELLAGMVALVRASVWELVREDMDTHVVMRGKDLCIESRELGVPCLPPSSAGADPVRHAPRRWTRFEALPPWRLRPPCPVRQPLLIGLRVDLGSEGRGRLAFTGRDAVHLRLNLEEASAKHVAMLDSLVRKGLAEYDAHQTKVRERIAAALAEMQRALAQDPAAPSSLKQTATTLTADKVVDEHGYWTQTRQSLQVVVHAGQLHADAHRARGRGEGSARSRCPPAARRCPWWAPCPRWPSPTSSSSRLSPGAARGPGEPQVGLHGAAAFMAEKDRWGRTFEEIGFSPEKGRRYTYCMDKQCLPCDRGGCKVSRRPRRARGSPPWGRARTTGSPSAPTATWTRMTPGTCGSSTRSDSRST